MDSQTKEALKRMEKASEQSKKKKLMKTNVSILNNVLENLVTISLI